MFLNLWWCCFLHLFYYSNRSFVETCFYFKFKLDLSFAYFRSRSNFIRSLLWSRLSTCVLLTANATLRINISWLFPITTLKRKTNNNKKLSIKKQHTAPSTRTMKNDVVRWSSAAIAPGARESTSHKSKPFPTLTATRAHPNVVTAHASSYSGHLELQKQQQYCDTNASFLNATKPVTTTKTSSYLIIPRQHSKRKSNTLSRHFQSQQRQKQTYNTHHRRQHGVKARTFAALHLNRILLNCVQLNVFLVFLLCTLNVGFVIVPNVSAAIVSNASDLLVGGAVNALDGGVTYQLDYEESNSGTDKDSATGHYTHTWAVHIPSGDDDVADQVARDHGFVNMGKVSEHAIPISQGIKSM